MVSIQGGIFEGPSCVAEACPRIEAAIPTTPANSTHERKKAFKASNPPAIAKPDRKQPHSCFNRTIESRPLYCRQHGSALPLNERCVHPGRGDAHLTRLD